MPWRIPPPTKRWLAALVGIDLVLVVVSLRGGGLQFGSSPLLDLWDILKATAIAIVLLTASRRARSAGLAVFGLAFLLIGLFDATRAHTIPARWIADLVPFHALGVHPHGVIAAAEFLVMLGLCAVLLATVLMVPGHWEPLPRVRARLIILLAAFVFFAGLVDVVETLSGDGRWSILEEAGERLMLSITLAYSAHVFTLARSSYSPSSQASAD